MDTLYKNNIEALGTEKYGNTDMYTSKIKNLATENGETLTCYIN